MPDFVFETALWKSGARYVAGADEAGRGCLAGPVVAAAVVLPPEADLPTLDDSKRLLPHVRESLFSEILSYAVAVGVGQCDPPEIDKLNILWASMEAMRRAVLDLAVPVDHVLVDGNYAIPNAPWPQQTIIRGDGLSMSIAAASVVAKVTRDRMMADFDMDYPEYGFPQHKGYATPEHAAALSAHGPCPLHRQSFRLGAS